MKNKCEATGKVCYDSKKEARDVLLQLKAACQFRYNGRRYKHRGRKPAQKRAYKCPFCQQYHLTKLAWFPANLPRSIKRNN
jgi:hypothetical protein